MTWACPYCFRENDNIFLIIECRDQCAKMEENIGLAKKTILNIEHHPVVEIMKPIQGVRPYVV